MALFAYGGDVTTRLTLADGQAGVLRCGLANLPLAGVVRPALAHRGRSALQPLGELRERRARRLVEVSVGARVGQVARQRHPPRLGNDRRGEHNLQEQACAALGQRLDALHQGEQLKLVPGQEPVVDEVPCLRVEPQREFSPQLFAVLAAVALGGLHDRPSRSQRLRRVDRRQLRRRDHPGERVDVAADGAAAETHGLH